MKPSAKKLLEMTPKNTGATLRDLREAKGLKAKFVADKMGIGYNTISMLENGCRTWSLNRIRQYLDAIGIV